MGATLKAPGHVCHGGRGLTRIGFLSRGAREKQKNLDQVVDLFTGAGLPTERVDNILDFVWSKLLVNAGINALTVIFNCPNGDLPLNRETRKMLVAAVLEGESVAKALGIALPEDPVRQTLAVCEATAGNISSMLQDVRRGRPTEIGAINGALLDKAEELGMELPVNRALVAGVKAIEAGYLQTALRGPSPDRL
jgi:2-dehydropantoate 2-reductase